MTLLRSSVVPALALTLVCALVAGIGRGSEGTVGALIGGAVVCLFFVSSPFALGPITKVSPQLSLLVAMIFFATKILALLALFVVVLGPEGIGDRVDDPSLGVTVILTTLAWTFFQIRGARRSRQPLYDLDDER